MKMAACSVPRRSRLLVLTLRVSSLQAARRVFISINSLGGFLRVHVPSNADAPTMTLVELRLSYFR
jgi:hypothetical protein